MIKDLVERFISKAHNVKVRPQPGCTIEDIEGHIKPIIRKNPDAIIIHSRTNDVTNDKPTKKKTKKGVKLIEDANPDIQVIISGLYVLIMSSTRFRVNPHSCLNVKELLARSRREI